LQLIAGSFHTGVTVMGVWHSSLRLDLQGVRKCLSPQPFIQTEKL